jgi:hypothetical protein
MSLNFTRAFTALTFALTALLGLAGFASAQPRPGIERIGPGIRPNMPIRPTPPPPMGPSFQHIDRLARQLERQARDLHEEVDNHFRPSPQYRHLHDDVEELEELADHIHDVLHRGASVTHLRADARKLDRLFHHVEDLVRDMGRSRTIDRRAYAHLRESLSRLEDTVHHLLDDLNRLR